MSLRLSIALALLASGCCVNPFHNTQRREEGVETEPGAPDQEAERPSQPAQPAVQPTGGGQRRAEGSGFDIRLVRVQPGVHLDTVQPCDVVFVGRPEAVEGRARRRYERPAVQRVAIKCAAETGEGWADLIFTEEDAAHVTDVRRGLRLRVRILAAEGGYFDYPIVAWVGEEGPASALGSGRPAPTSVPNGFDLRALVEEPTLVGTSQTCAVAFADEIDLVGPQDRRRRSYPAGVQNRMTVRCKHAGGEEPADLVFMPSQALAALEVRRGESIPVRVVSRNGGFVDYPILQYAGQ